MKICLLLILLNVYKTTSSSYNILALENNEERSILNANDTHHDSYGETKLEVEHSNLPSSHLKDSQPLSSTLEAKDDCMLSALISFLEQEIYFVLEKGSLEDKKLLSGYNLDVPIDDIETYFDKLLREEEEITSLNINKGNQTLETEEIQSNPTCTISEAKQLVLETVTSYQPKAFIVNTTIESNIIIAVDISEKLEKMTFSDDTNFPLKETVEESCSEKDSNKEIDDTDVSLIEEQETKSQENKAIERTERKLLVHKAIIQDESLQTAVVQDKLISLKIFKEESSGDKDLVCSKRQNLQSSNEHFPVKRIRIDTPPSKEELQTHNHSLDNLNQFSVSKINYEESLNLKQQTILNCSEIFQRSYKVDEKSFNVQINHTILLKEYLKMLSYCEIPKEFEDILNEELKIKLNLIKEIEKEILKLKDTENFNLLLRIL